MKDWRIISGILAPVVTFSFIAAAILVHPWFDWHNNALSDLGASDVDMSWIFNIGPMIGGSLTAIFGSYLFEKARGIVKLAFAVFLPAGIFLAMVGVFPEGHPVHFPSAVLFYLLSGIAMLIFGACLLLRGNRIYGGLSLLIAFSAAILMILPGWSALAIPETIGAAAISLWTYLLIWGMERGGIKWTTGTT